MKDYHQEEWMTNIPLYAVCNIWGNKDIRSERMKDERNRENDGTYTDNRSLAAEGIDPEGYSERYYYYYVYDRRSTNSYCSVLNLLVRVLSFWTASRADSMEAAALPAE